MNNNIKETLKVPAIGLLVTGVFNVLMGLYFVLSIVVQAAMGQLNRSFGSDEERLGFYFGFFGVGILGLIGLAVAPLIIYGALQMMKGKKYGISKTAAVFALVPATSCCFVLGVPFGIWSLVVLFRPEVKSYFESGG